MKGIKRVLIAEPWFIVMAKAEHGDVLSYLNTIQSNGDALPREELIGILKGIIAGLEYLQSKNVSHK